MTILRLALVVLASGPQTSSAIVTSSNSSWGRSCSGTGEMRFATYVNKFRKGYTAGTTEYEKRRKIFVERSLSIGRHNCMSKEPWSAGINHLTDWTEAELKSLRGFKKGGRVGGMPSLDSVPMFDAGARAADLPEKVDWGHLESISEARDQGQCGSCWAYAAETVMRAHAEINNRTHRFSVAQIIACTPNPNECGGKGGCEGATAELAYEYVLKAGSVDEKDMPSPAGGSQAACPAEMRVPEDTHTPPIITADGAEKHMLPESAPSMRGGMIGMTGWTKFPENKEMPLAQALVEHGPLAVAVAAGFDWNWYFQGIMTPKGCDQEFVISHAVVLFGFGKANSPKAGVVRYWHIKNSWGQGWGENGNLRLQRLDEEEKYCGWDKQPEVGSGCKGGPSKVWVCGSCGILYDTVMPHFHPAN